MAFDGPLQGGVRLANAWGGRFSNTELAATSAVAFGSEVFWEPSSVAPDAGPDVCVYNGSDPGFVDTFGRPIAPFSIPLVLA